MAETGRLDPAPLPVDRLPVDREGPDAGDGLGRNSARRACAALRVRTLGTRPYLVVLEAMRGFTEERDPFTEDELWLVQHPAVFTLGQAGRREHVLAAGDVPVVHSDRGGQVTFHAPGQLVAYTLIDLKRARLGVRDFVHLLEECTIGILRSAGLPAARRPGAPGVYLDAAKIAALGLRVRRGCAYHGLALNVSLDLEPFSRIDPCGYPGLVVTRLADHGLDWTVDEAGGRFALAFAARLGRRVELERQTPCAAGRCRV